MEGDLLGFREKVIGVSVQRQLADAAHRNEFLRDDLGRVEEVEVEFELVLFIDDLQAQLPLGIVAALDRLEEVATVKIGILARDLLRLIPSRFGAIPKPTVKVRMEENGKIWRTHACRPLRPVSP